MMCKIINFLVLTILGLIVVSEGQIIQNGSCSYPPRFESNFAMNEFINGTWYEVARTNHPQGGDCASVSFSQIGSDYFVNYNNVKSNFLESHTGNARLQNGTGRIELTMPDATEIGFWVLEFMPDGFALAYNCVNITNTTREIYIWQLGRNSILTSSFITRMNQTMSEYFGITNDALYQVDHSETACFELPVIPTGQAVILPGQCEDIPAVQNFSPGDFLNVWHEIYSYHSDSALGTCGRAQYSTQDGEVVNIVNSEIINQTLRTIEGNATVNSTDGSGKLNVVLEILPNVTQEMNLTIIATNYTEWAISYSCQNLANNTKRIFSWILSRKRTLTDDVRDAINAVVASHLELNFEYYELTNQTNSGCFYIPQLEDGPVFGGQCNQNMSTYPNFDANEYLGLWHEIESYPTPFQSGSCANALYTSGDGVVDVLNTQVINETLDVINGVAIIPDPNQAKLVVTFPILGTNLTTDADYFVIRTDYSNYSLVYSCSNVNDYQQRIFMWKLSRTKSLSDQANNEINDALTTEAVFDPRFFDITGQSREDCFYYPEPVLGETVVFPGQCSDDAIPVVSNFNFTLFSGDWYETQAYPKEFQPGTCVTHRFSNVNNTVLNLVSTSVVNSTLETTIGNLSLVNGTDARFTLRITTNGTVIEFPYYIVATNYTDYALAYSCVDIDNDRRAIYSWKLSRQGELSNDSLSNIETAMEPIRVLNEEYFERVDQSDDACFYFPDLAPGEPVVLPGRCDNDTVIPVMTNFDAAAYLGRWRLIESYPSTFQVGECNQAQYSLNGDIVIVYNTEVVNQTLSEATGTAELVTDSNDQTIGKLVVRFPESPNTTLELWILDTDYSNFSLVYACVDLPATNQRQVLSWKMSRYTNLSDEAREIIDNKISNITVLDNRYYEDVDHSDAACFYYPELDPSTSVRFPGQCNESIEVVTGFDAEAYMGQWYDIKRYPAPFQDGTCGNAFYSLREGPVVDVFNTQVVNQTLDTIIGTAVLATNDSSAKLSVTFPVGGFNLTSPYWVLAVNYSSYALVYSCTNDGPEHRIVTSWMLSRTKTLSNETLAEIDEVVNRIDVLDNRYYIDQNQTAEGCFYFPDPEPGKPVVFPGRCADTNINVVENFNLSSFSGEWYEVQAYPKEFQPGTCVTHRFSSVNNTVLNLETTSVVNRILETTMGNLTLMNGTDARFTLRIASNGTIIEFPYYIVATNYTDYALAYSCVDLDNDHKAIYSWKLSRQGELSNDSLSNIETAMEPIRVLDEQYFERVDQSDDACFYFPDLAPGEPVVLPGRCDNDSVIPVMTNFDAAAYLGRWRLIESYPSTFQVGECNQAQYSLNDSIVIVYNTEVVNQTLSEATGTAELVTDSNNQTIGKLVVRFPESPNTTLELWILDTDYSNFSLVYACVDLPATNQRQVLSWKMSRYTNLSDEAREIIDNKISNITVLDNRYYEDVDHSDAACFYYPELDPSTSVRFPGQCNESIEVVTGFDAVAYMDQWYDIKRYPAPFQDGTCGNAFYSLREGPVVDVFNTQVVNQTLDTIIGTAVLATNDSSAKLSVTFPVGGFNLTSPYWVLAVNYSSYALVYSCTNDGPEHRIVTSWMLSRTKTLSNETLAEIDEVVNGIDVLDNRYYIDQNQTAEGCFYFPDPEPGKPVVFPGRCADTNINVVENFNLSSFSGEWYEVQAYPKEFQPGTCVTHRFSSVNNTVLNLETTSVVNRILETTTGNLTLMNGTDARFTLRIASNGTIIEFPYYIVATNYTDYALAYSCVDLDNDHKAIYSWKLSRERELSNDSLSNIETAMEPIRVLDEQYFERVDQSDDACFYFPDLAPGEPVVLPGRCDNDSDIPVMTNFDAAAYLGRWRLIESYPSTFQVGECNQAQYSLNGSIVIVYNTEVVNQTLSEATGTAELVTDSNDQTIGKLVVRFPESPNTTLELWILDTDYSNFSLVYACVDLPATNQRQVLSWKMSRYTNLSDEAREIIDNKISNITVLDDRYYEDVDHSDAACFYYPELDPSTSVRFPGQCNESIEVVTGFDAEAYMGQWYDIKRYPAPFQDGTCGNAFYSLREGPVVDVFNTQVVNQTLDTIIGTAVLATNDSSAKLSVTFPVGGFNLTSPYWVLAVNYSSYALVYSCTNDGPEHRIVTSWMLSRTKTLSNETLAEIDEVVNGIDVLDNRYYIDQNQTAEGCFYFPDPEPGKPVVFPGRCADTNINVVENFNLSSFSGEWYEVQAYPKEFQPGTCVTHRFSSVNNTVLNLETTSVVNRILETTTGNLTLMNGTDARFTLRIASNGTIIEFPYYIVATNYTDYALAYSCVDLDNDHKAIYSWKLSRERELSNDSLSNIETAMEPIRVLDEQYFERVDQSDDACFYFPDLAPGEPVVLPGRCDNDSVIPVMTNFDAAAYLGRWRLIESYPSTFQVGECNQAQYSLNGSIVIVYNTEVVNQTLSEATGTAQLVTDSNNQTIGKLLVRFPESPNPLELWVLETDYENFTLVYACVDLPATNQRQVLSWKMSRYTNLSDEAREIIDNKISNITVLDDRYYEDVDHSDAACFYYPELDPSTSVRFPGQCNESIEVVTGFDAVAYMGQWYDIKRYPAPFQDGTCGNAFYSLREGPVVDVFNTQVVNQTLDTIIGTAVLATNDSSAKLSVTFPVGGFNLTSPYWVLAVNYSSYALVYSCTNDGPEHRIVTSWMLSRTKTLSNETLAEIDEVVNGIDVLDNRYYIDQNQTVEGCFYFPDPEPGKPVVFPGRCADTNINVVENFNLSSFSGEWYEVQAYPKEFQPGTCVTHRFSSVNNTVLNLETTSVVNRILETTMGNLTLMNGTDARFTLRIASNGTIIEFPYYIVATNYTDYALAYSCVDLDNDHKAIYSWKLSRERELSNDSLSNIETAMEPIRVLDEQYFERVDQSDDACFYFPDLAPGEPVVLPGRCDNDSVIPVMTNFDAASYLGRWRLIESYPSTFQVGECNQAQYSLNGSIVIVYNTEVVNQTLSEATGTAQLVTDSNNQTIGKLEVRFPESPNTTLELWILDTDYSNFSLVYACVDLPATNQRQVLSWKMSKYTNLSDEAREIIDNKISNITVLDNRYYEDVDHSDAACFYYPELDPSTSVRFPGQCNESIEVVTGFDAVAYMDQWYDIKRYPAPFQDGTCGNAFYSLREGPVVDVFNTQVVNQTLDTIIGTAVLATNDSSAKLLVTFPDTGPPSPYWVLAVNYTSYALVYSCTNDGPEHRIVTSWMLSRTKTLSNETLAEIDEVVNRIDVLDNRYYIDQNQTAEGCFYFPDPEPGKPVVFPGRCADTNINVVENFNLSRFAGRWHEIEAYPKDEQTGQCISHEFTLNANNTLDFESYNVIAQSLGIVSGTVISTNNSAQLELQFVSNGTNITIPYWIVATDYESYALAYSCVNQGLHNRGVWSWKLSRTKELNDTSIIAINNATANIDVLDDIYYEKINQTDESCFYYPDIGLGEPVIFPGQCDENITGVPNFDAANYLGTWNLIETYHSEFQLGDCGDATYTLLPNETVNVFNTEVINQTLSTITGLAVAADDGTGKLFVTFPDAPAPVEYYILATDYFNYSIVYSCVNIGEDHRRVFSWKLSRNNSLSVQAEAEINNTISRIDVLNSRYYQTVNRSDDSCFYFPQPDGRPVVFRGECDQNIQTVMNFDAVGYNGTWYNIQSYPAPFQDGVCGTANYNLNLETLIVDVENTQVIDRDGFGPVQDVQTGTAVISSNDTSAKLLVTFEVNGQIVTSDYWVLATDYGNYSLVYSCQNLDNRRRQVISWKLGRQKVLSQSSIDAIAEALDRVQVLEQAYFVDEGQSDTDCFFYPDNEDGDVILGGQCIPDAQVPTVGNFSAALFSAGPWYEVARFPSDLQEGECTNLEFSVASQNSITYTEVNNEFQTINVIPGILDPNGVIRTDIEGIPVNTFHILDVDYNQYALLYGCRNNTNDTKQVYSWKLTRNSSGQLTPEANIRIDDAVRNNTDLFEHYFSYTDHSNDACFHYPEFEVPPGSIQLSGHCDESIRGIANFSAADYLGRWIEIEKYPQPDQMGTCGRAHYSLGDTNVLVRNTQVIDERLAEQLGFAEVASTDGSGLLNVTFVVNGVTVHANYYILATDYTSYALVYSCRNLTNNMRLVSSWKLSRNFTLSNQAIAVMDDMINRTQGLRQEYYVPTDQSVDACFYIPEVDVNQAPVFIGQCENITGVTNFNASRYAGWWHEIERYPVDNYRGECISSNYAALGDAYLVTDTVVLNGTASVSTGAVEISADGRLRRTINGQVQDIWVLATDYENYALLYSCENIDDEHRRVWSAKHSKTRALNATAQSAMAPVIESNKVLYPEFYQNVNQSNEACFHYPPPTGQQIILPGQCDENITVVDNFDVQAYEGTWYQIERYPQIHENPNSTCIGARYTLNEASGVVTVLNWEILNGTLLTIEGNATVASSDGSAKLSVVLPVRDSPTNATVTTSLYVLTTDYENYSLAYSCSNINSFQRSIGAWKLSRNRTLSAASNATINTYMSARQEFQQSYFVSVAQNETCEEPSSGTYLRSSFIVMVICALWQILS